MRKALPLLVIVTASILLGWFLHRPEERIEWREKTVVKVEHHTDTIVEKVPVYVEVVRTDSVLVMLTDTLYQPVLVNVPIEHKRETFEDGEVYYHGYMAGVDSLRAFRHTQIVTAEITRTEKTSRWGIGLTAGYGAGKGGLTPYVGIGLNYRLVSFPARKSGRERGIDYE